MDAEIVVPDKRVDDPSFFQALTNTVENTVGIKTAKYTKGINSVTIEGIPKDKLELARTVIKYSVCEYAYIKYNWSEKSISKVNNLVVGFTKNGTKTSIIKKAYGYYDDEIVKFMYVRTVKGAQLMGKTQEDPTWRPYYKFPEPDKILSESEYIMTKPINDIWKN